MYELRGPGQAKPGSLARSHLHYESARSHALVRDALGISIAPVCADSLTSKLCLSKVLFRFYCLEILTEEFQQFQTGSK
jgi:hypothetical protein